VGVRVLDGADGVDEGQAQSGVEDRHARRRGVDYVVSVQELVQVCIARAAAAQEGEAAGYCIFPGFPRLGVA
jgi:hypothetical protein